MKKIILLLVVHFVCSNAFCQNIIFQDPFNDPTFSPGWHTNTGNWQIVDLVKRGLKPPGGDNHFALTGSGNSSIQVDIPFITKEKVIQVQLSLNYWIYYGSSGSISVDLLDKAGVVIAQSLSQVLLQKGKWDLFDQKFKVTSETFYIRVKLGGHTNPMSPNSGSTVYFKNIMLSAKS